jgi:hypothetical protein
LQIWPVWLDCEEFPLLSQQQGVSPSFARSLHRISIDLMPGACSQSTGQLPVSFNSVGVAVVTVAAISYMAATGLGASRVHWFERDKIEF